jgi:hypothetical protein
VILLRQVAVDRPSQHTLVQTAADIWATSPQHLAMTVERLLSHRLVSTLSIIDWVFSAWTALLNGSAPSAVSAAVRVRPSPPPRASDASGYGFGGCCAVSCVSARADHRLEARSERGSD